jgi:hypothetical protein
MSTEPEYRDRLATAIMQMIADHSTTGETTAIPARDTGEALLLVLAAMITGTEATRTPKALRETAEAFAKDLRVQVRHMQDVYDRVGRRPFDAELVVPS